MSVHENYLRSTVFGFQDALVSTTGVIVGVAIGTQDKSVVLLAGVATIMVEALSMAAGQYMSEKTVQQMNKTKKHTDNLVIGALIMYGSYFLGGLVPLLPIVIFPLPQASYVSIIFSLLGLLVLGIIKAKIVKESVVRSALEILLLGGAATAVGLLVGYFLKV
ncbi:MAG: VIT1/CCC1 transporter family protein [Candidatus Levybacteria bacterium]|nr:VIT1/CCC1 transporter family protein [Candidatus Levybacteria bacterium]